MGAAYLSGSSAPGGRTEAVGQVAGSLQRTIGQTDVAVEAGYERNIEVSLVRGGARARGALGSASGDLQHDLDSGTTQYSLNVTTGVAMTPRTWAVGGREIADSGIIVGVDGEAGGGTFEILINDVPRAQLSAGGRVPIFLPPYREYSVRIRPSDGPRVAFDTSARRVTLYPGNVEPLQWKVEPIMTAFGRVVRPNGSPAANAEISTRRGIGRTDEKGFFQIEIGAAEVATLKWPDQKGCAMKLSSGPPKAEYVSLGTLICE
jgi:outer membrane usher protein FimD/PapC